MKITCFMMMSLDDRIDCKYAKNGRFTRTLLVRDNPSLEDLYLSDLSDKFTFVFDTI